MHQDSSPRKGRKHQYPPDEELLSLVEQHRGVKMVARHLGLPDSTFNNYLIRRPELKERVREVLQPQRGPFTYTCDYCKESFTREVNPETFFKTNERAFCSMRCYHDACRLHPPRACLNCGTMFESGRGSYNATKQYCCASCYHAAIATTWVQKECVQCGSTFQVSGKRAIRAKFCSQSCKTAETVYVDCRGCGETFTGSRYANRFYCSSACRPAPLAQQCKTCAKIFTVGPTEKRIFCSLACYRRYTGETELEAIVRRALTFLEIDFIQEHPMGRYSIDFALPESCIAIEVDGAYWHRNPERDKPKTAFLEGHGWRVIRFGEKEINTTDDVPNLIVSHLPSEAFERPVSEQKSHIGTSGEPHQGSLF